MGNETSGEPMAIWRADQDHNTMSRCMALASHVTLVILSGLVALGGLLSSDAAVAVV